MVHAGEMQQTVEKKDAHLVSEAVSEVSGLPSRGFKRDGEIAGVEGRHFSGRRKTENVRGLVLAAKPFIEAAQDTVIGQEHLDLSG
jgi:hypothetical protein